MTDAIISTLTAAATLLKADPVLGTELKGVWTYPPEYEKINLSRNNNLPASIVTYEVNLDQQWKIKGANVGRNSWMLQIMILLKKGAITVQSEIWREEIEQTQFVEWVADFLYSNMKLSGTVQQIGEGEVLFNYRIGNLHWDGEEFWGIIINAPVMQTHLQQMGA